MNGMSNAEHTLLSRYVRELRTSNPWSAGANPLAGGAPHDSWRLDPFPVAFERGHGVYKWDNAGRRYLDLWMGHGSLMLGNAHPAVVEAVTRQMSQGQHLGGVHVLHYAWAERIRQFVPSCEKIRFTSSGTEATLLALRVARAWTGRARVIRVDGHFHGWHDEALAHALPSQHSGFNPGASEFVTVVPPLDVDAVLDELAEGDVAAILVEPGGGSAGCLPWSAEYLGALRRLADMHGALLVFDEVISGFRYAPGGVQGLANVLPDITVLAKIAAGGMPGAVVGGRADVMSVFSGGQSAYGDPVYAPHSGTFNGFPLSAAATLATLDLIRDGEAGAKAVRSAAYLVDAINAAAMAADVDVRAFHQSSIFHLMIGALDEGAAIGPGAAAIRLAREHAPLHKLLRTALLLEGIDCHASHGWLSAVHENSHLDEAIGGFERAFAVLRNIPAFQHAQSGALSQTPKGKWEDICHAPACGSRFPAAADRVYGDGYLAV